MFVRVVEIGKGKVGHMRVDIVFEKTFGNIAVHIFQTKSTLIPALGDIAEEKISLKQFSYKGRLP